MRQLTSEELNDATKTYLRQAIPPLFSDLQPIERALYAEDTVHPNSWYGAVAVQRLAGGTLLAVHPALPPGATEDAHDKRHIVNLLGDRTFDVFGIIPDQPVVDVQPLVSTAPLVESPDVVIQVENRLDAVRRVLGLPDEMLK